MRICLFTLVLLASLGTRVGSASEKNDGSLDSIASAARASTAQTCPLLLTAHVVQNGDGYVLAFTLKNIAGRPLSFNRPDLPWGNVHSIETAAVTTQGHLVVRGGFPIEDVFGLDRVTIRPDETLTGNYALSRRWGSFPRNETIVLMWAYKVRAEQFPPMQLPVCTGVTSFKVSG